MDDYYLQALAQIESGVNDYAIGKKGEVSRYQILPSTWAEYKVGGLHLSVNPDVSSHVAFRHLQFICSELGKHLGEYTTEDVYVAWNIGVEKYKKRYKFKPELLSKRIRERAIRFANLCDYFKNNRQN